MKTASTFFYIENQGLRNQAGESLEQAYVRLEAEGEAIKTYTIEEWADPDRSDIWADLEAAGYDDPAEISDEINFDPFAGRYIRRMAEQAESDAAKAKLEWYGAE